MNRSVKTNGQIRTKDSPSEKVPAAKAKGFVDSQDKPRKFETFRQSEDTKTGQNSCKYDDTANHSAELLIDICDPIQEKLNI